MFDKETIEPSNSAKHGQTQWYNFTFIDISLDRKWSSIIFAKRNFDKETLEPLFKLIWKLGKYSMT